MSKYVTSYGYHALAIKDVLHPSWVIRNDTQFSYDFENFFHPYVGDLIAALNTSSLAGMLAPNTQSTSETFFDTLYTLHESNLVKIERHDKNIDVADGGPYANYNWELFFHIPVTVAVHLSKSQRFAEAQRWFHYVFDPMGTDTSVPVPQRYWKFLRFRQGGVPDNISTLLALLSTPDSECTPDQLAQKTQILAGYEANRHHPFSPHAVARTRPVAYQYQVLMKYLDNLIAWGDSLFLQDTVESINEATGRYVLAANLLGPRPQQVPLSGTIKPQTFAQLKAKGLDATGNAFVQLEGQFPFNLTAPQTQPADGAAGRALFGIGRTLYFCVPANDTLLGYWDTVADRLYKIRHCMNIEGIVRQLALFDPPLDPGMLVKAAAAGIDVGSILAGTNQPAGPVRALPLIQKSLELANEVRALGASLLSAIEKQDSEHLALLRQSHEVKVQQLAQDVRFLQWKSTEEATESLLRARANSWERYRYFLRLQGLTPDEGTAPETLPLTRTQLTAETFDDVHATLVDRYGTEVALQTYPSLKLAAGASPSDQSGATGGGSLYLSSTEDTELTHLASARDFRLAGSVSDTVAGVLTFIPEFNVDLHFWGLGASSKVFGGSKLSDATKIASEILKTIAGYHGDQAGIAGRTASQERRSDDWMLQANLAARELRHTGRQIIASLLAEQIAYHEYQNVQSQVADSEDVDDFLHAKFSNEDLYGWMQAEISRLYYQWYRFAFDTARKAEQTMKLELRRPELDGTDFVKFNYWDGGRKGLLAGESLQLDVKRMEMAYHENNRRELELTRHVSLRQLDPLALLRLKANGTAAFAIPEWLYDRDYPGHYLRRIKSVAVSVPCVVGPYTPLPCTLSIQRSSIRTSAQLMDNRYGRAADDDGRFVDLFGPVESIATSSGTSDAGMFDPAGHDDRLLPFEGAGAISSWQISLPAQLRSFDYASIADVIVHIRYTARDGGDLLGGQAVTEMKQTLSEVQDSGLALLLSLPFDFATEWAAFSAGTADFSAAINKNFFPYLVQDKTLTVADTLEIYSGTRKLARRTIAAPAGLDNALNTPPFDAVLTIPADTTVLTRDARDVFVVIRYSFADA